MNSKLIFPIAMLATLSACSGGSDITSQVAGAQQVSAPDKGVAIVKLPPSDACQELSARDIAASSIGLPTRGAIIDSVAFIKSSAEGNVHGEYCAVKGQIKPVDPNAPAIKFQINLPTEWNRDGIRYGGGSFNGVVIDGLSTWLLPSDAKNPLARGFVTFGSDAGHSDPRSPAIFADSVAFALNQEAWLNHAHQAIKKTRDVAGELIKVRYGVPSKRVYFFGDSQGGNEALIAAGRYPKDYDGVVSLYPGYGIPVLHLGIFNVARAMYENGGAGWMNKAKTQMLVTKVYGACDNLDGARDGLISNVSGCNAAFNIETVRSQLRCPDGKDTADTCLSDAQIGAIQRISSPYKMGFAINGQSEYPKLPILEGSDFNVFSLGDAAVPTPGTENIFYNVGAATIRYAVTKDPGFDPMTFDPHAWKAQLEQTASALDVNDLSFD